MMGRRHYQEIADVLHGATLKVERNPDVSATDIVDSIAVGLQYVHITRTGRISRQFAAIHKDALNQITYIKLLGTPHPSADVLLLHMTAGIMDVCWNDNPRFNYARFREWVSTGHDLPRNRR